MTDIITIQNVRGYCDDKGTAYLNVEDLARRLDFAMVRKDRVSTSGDNYEAVRWERVNGYLKDFATFINGAVEFKGVKAGDYIPEQMAYLLAMKANNDVAKAFQWQHANEIVPSIRRECTSIRTRRLIRVSFDEWRTKLNSATVKSPSLSPKPIASTRSCRGKRSIECSPTS